MLIYKERIIIIKIDNSRNVLLSEILNLCKFHTVNNNQIGIN